MQTIRFMEATYFRELLQGDLARAWKEGSLTSLRTEAHMSLLRFSSSSAFFSIAAFRSARA